MGPKTVVLLVATTSTLSDNNLDELLTEGHAGGDLDNLSVNLT